MVGQLVSVDRAGSDHKDDQDKVLPGTSSILFVPFMSFRLRQPPGKKCPQGEVAAKTTGQSKEETRERLREGKFLPEQMAVATQCRKDFKNVF